MKRWIGLALLVFVAAAGWRIGDTLSPDALSMAVGVLFGVMAGVPTALLVMAGSRRHGNSRPDENSLRVPQGPAMRLQGPGHGQMIGPANGWGLPSYVHQPPIIVVAGPQGFGGALQPAPAHAGWLAPEPPARTFTVVGDREELVEDW